MAVSDTLAPDYRAPRPARRRGRDRGDWTFGAAISVGDFACLIIPALQFFQLTFGGRIYASDICLLAALPFVLARYGHWVDKKLILRTVGLGFLWLTAQIASDILNGTTPDDYSRGWTKILFTISHFVTIALLIRYSIRRLMIYAVGWALGGILTFVLAPGEYAQEYPWKFGLGWYVTLLACLVAAVVARKHPARGILLMLAMAGLNIVLDSRASGALCATAAIYSAFRLTPAFARKHIGGLQTGLVFVALAAGGWAISAFYNHGAMAGWFGDKAQEKYLMQSRGEGGLLLGGRGEILAASSAIADAPVLGHGSWAKDAKYTALLVDRRAELGYGTFGGPVESDLIPSHSHLLGAWVEAGVAGALFWLFALSTTARGLLRATGREPLLPFFAFIGMSLLWDILFSPYGADRRFTTTYYMYAMCLFYWHSLGNSTTRSHA